MRREHPFLTRRYVDSTFVMFCNCILENELDGLAEREPHKRVAAPDRHHICALDKNKQTWQEKGAVATRRRAAVMAALVTEGEWRGWLRGRCGCERVRCGQGHLRRLCATRLGEDGRAGATAMVIRAKMPRENPRARCPRRTCALAPAPTPRRPIVACMALAPHHGRSLNNLPHGLGERRKCAAHAQRARAIDIIRKTFPSLIAHMCANGRKSAKSSRSAHFHYSVLHKP